MVARLVLPGSFVQADLQDELEALPSGSRLGSRRSSDWLYTTLLVAVAALVVLAIALGSGSEQRAIRRLPEDQRQALLTRAIDDLRQSCGEGRPDGLRTHCRQLAEFAAQFDECTGACAAYVRRELTPKPTR
jgi:hypothetical protein